MDELDFFEGIRGTPEQEAEEYFSKLKTSGIKSQVAGFARRNAPELIGGAVGAGAIGAGTYTRNRRKNDAPSTEQRYADEHLKSFKDPQGFTAETQHASAKFRKDLSDVFAKHPGKAALLSAPIGAQLGALIAKKLLK